MEELTYRTYVFVERHLSPIDKGIQSAHAIIEYYNEAKLWNKEEESANFDKWAHFDKTLILLDGGTVNDLDELDEKLTELRIHHGSFRETDLDNILTAIAVVVDERVYNKEKYLDFDEWVTKEYRDAIMSTQEVGCYYNIKTDSSTISISEDKKPIYYKEWVEFIGGEKNVFLRQFIQNKKLTR